MSPYNRAVARPRILLIRLGAIGDVARTLPALSLVRRRLPDAFIAWIVEGRSLPLLGGHPDLDQVIVLDREALARYLSSPDTFFRGFASMGGVLGTLRKGRFTVSLDFQGTLKSGLISFAAGAEQRVGYEKSAVKEGNHLFTNVHIALPPPPVHRVRRNLALLGALGIDEIPETVTATLPITAEHRTEADRALSSLNVAPGEPFVFLYPGSSRLQAYKRVPASILAEVARMLIAADRTLVIGTGPGEEPIAQAILAHAGPATRLLPATSLLGMAEIIRRAGLFIGADTGPMHMAWVQGVPVVALFGPTDPALNAPWGHGHVVFDALPVSPASARGNDRQPRRPRDPSVFLSLEPARIAEAALARLSENPARACVGDAGGAPPRSILARSRTSLRTS